MDGSIIILSHYISTGGASGFDHMLTVSLGRVDTQPLVLRSTWPIYLTIDGTADSYTDRLVTGTAYSGVLYVYNSTTNLPTTLAVTINVELDYYYGREDGFADFVHFCPSNGTPASPSMCLNGASD